MPYTGVELVAKLIIVPSLIPLAVTLSSVIGVLPVFSIRHDNESVEITVPSDLMASGTVVGIVNDTFGTGTF